MITLYGFGPRFGLPDPSPFVVKAMLLLKIAGLDHRTVSLSNPGKGPKGKLPFIEDAGERIGDTSFIRFHIEQKYGFDFDAGLAPREKATAWAVEKMCDEHLYWAIIDVRWRHTENFNKGPRSFFDGIPAPLRPLVVALIRRKSLAAMKSQGFGLHSSSEIAALAIRDLQAIADLLGDKDYLMGATPCSADAAVYAMVSGLMVPMFDTPIRGAAQAMPNLLAYRDRMAARYFSEPPAA